MPPNPARYGLTSPTEPTVHDLPPIRFANELIAVKVEVRRTEDGIWRGRILFAAPSSEALLATGDILCAATENDLWESVRDLRDHHLRDLYRSLLE